MNNIIKTIEDKINKLWYKNGGHLSDEQKFFYIELFQKLQPKNCLEIGFAGGRHTATLLCSCSPVKVISIDINFNYQNGRIFIEKIKNEYNNIQFIENDSNILLNSNFFSEHFADGLDYVLVDGGHSYKEAMTDMINCYPYVSQNGIMIVDDYKSSPPLGCSIPSVDKAIEDFANINKIQFETVKLKDGKGMAIFKK